MKIWHLAVALPFMIQTAHAFKSTSQNDCTSIDLRNPSLGETRDQKNVAWCYAFTSADTLAHAFGAQEKYSAADIAIAYNETKVGRLVRWLDVNIANRRDPSRRKMAHQTGFNKVSLKTALKNGYCPESVFPSEKWSRMERTVDGWTESQVPLKTAMLEISALHSNRRSLDADNIPFYYSFKNVDSQTFVDMLQKKKVASFYSALRRTVCRDDRQSFSQKWKVKMAMKSPRVFKKISHQLEASRVVGIDYDSRILRDHTSRGASVPYLHTSNIVGRRWNQEQNSCEFLIRDSYGSRCEGKYDPSYDCEAGNVWIGESKIYSSLVSIVYMLYGN